MRFILIVAAPLVAVVYSPILGVEEGLVVSCLSAYTAGLYAGYIIKNILE